MRLRGWRPRCGSGRCHDLLAPPSLAERDRNADGGSAQYAVGPEIGFTLTDNLRAGLGYNFNGFSDRDLTQEEYTSHGLYLALRLKFDESLFGTRRKEVK